MGNFCIVLGSICSFLLLFRILDSRPNKRSMGIRTAPIPKPKKSHTYYGVFDNSKVFEKSPNPSKFDKEVIEYLAEEIIIGYPKSEYEKEVLRIYGQNIKGFKRQLMPPPAPKPRLVK